MTFTKQQIEDIESKVCYLALYDPNTDLSKALGKQIKYLGEFLRHDEEIIIPVFTKVNWPGSCINKNAATMIFFTNKRIIIGYKYWYFFRNLKCFYSVSYSDTDFLEQKLEPSPITIKTKKGNITFSIANKAFLSRDIYKDYYCSSYYLGQKIFQLQLKNFVELNLDSKELQNNETFNKAKDTIKDIEKDMYKINDFHKALLFCAMNLEILSDDSIKCIMANGYDKFIEENPDLKDLPKPLFYYPI